MGNTCCGKHFVPNNRIEGQGSEVLVVQKLLGYTDADLDTLYTYFSRIDFDTSGQVDIVEFVVVNEIDNNPGEALFGEIIFRMFDKDSDGKGTFQELLIFLWVFLTLEREPLIAFSFQVFDTDDSGCLTKEEIKFLVSLIWNHNIDKHVHDAFTILDKNKDQFISLGEFIVHSRNTPIMLFPIFQVQLKLRDKTLGQGAWSRLSDFRASSRNAITFDKLKQLVSPREKSKAVSFIMHYYEKRNLAHLLPDDFKRRLKRSPHPRAQAVMLGEISNVPVDKQSITERLQKVGSNSEDESAVANSRVKMKPVQELTKEKSASKIQALARGVATRKKTRRTSVAPQELDDSGMEPVRGHHQSQSQQQQGSAVIRHA